MSLLFFGVEFGAGLALIAAGFALTWYMRGGEPTALGLSVVPVGALALIVIGGALMLNSLRII